MFSEIIIYDNDIETIIIIWRIGSAQQSLCTPLYISIRRRMNITRCVLVINQCFLNLAHPKLLNAAYKKTQTAYFKRALSHITIHMICPRWDTHIHMTEYYIPSRNEISHILVKISLFIGSLIPSHHQIVHVLFPPLTGRIIFFPKTTQ